MTLAVTMLAAACDNVPSSSTRTPSRLDQLPIDEISARLVGEYPLFPSALSPDGSWLFGWMGDQNPVASLTVCLAEVDNSDRTGDQCSTAAVDRNGPVLEGYFHSGFSPAWSPMGDRVAWMSLGDLWSYDVGAGTITGITDDGVADAQETGGDLPVDFWPAWRSAAELTFLRSNPDETENNLMTVDLSGAETGRIAAPTHSAPDGIPRPEWRLRFGPPLVVDEKAYLAATDVIHEVDLDSGQIDILAEYAEQYLLLAEQFERLVGISIEPDGTNLIPVGFTSSGEMLVWDTTVFTALNQTGGAGGGPSGAFLLNRNDDLTPLFMTSNQDGRYLAPMSVGISPGGTKLVFVWLDAVGLDTLTLNSHVSILDLEATELPADPRLLPEIWSAPAEVLLGFADPVIEWAADDRISLSAFRTSGILTYVLQLEEHNTP